MAIGSLEKPGQRGSDIVEMFVYNFQQQVDSAKKLLAGIRYVDNLEQSENAANRYIGQFVEKGFFGRDRVENVLSETGMTNMELATYLRTAQEHVQSRQFEVEAAGGYAAMEAERNMSIEA